MHLLDPFAGAGVFLSRLLQSDLIQDGDLERKYREELHANEIVLLAYYIAAVNIEEAYRGRRGEDSEYEPFSGIVLADTFNLNKKGENPTLFGRAWMPDNNARAERQQKLPIQVIVGNPPWSAGQKIATDDNPNVEYSELETRIKETYAEYSTVTNKRHLYDTYKMAIRWASDRISGQGVIAFVTNGSWIDGNVDAGVRACLAEEFSSIYVLHLRGNQRTQGERSKREGGKVFGQGSRAPVAITIMVKNPRAAHDGCRIHYRDIGDYLSREQKLAALKEAVSIAGVRDWQDIAPDKHNDWIGQRGEVFARFYPMGSKEAKAGSANDAIFGLYSLGLATGRDPYIYNFSRDACAKNARKMTENYLAAIPDIEQGPDISLADIASRHSSNLKWNRELEKNLQRRRKTEYDEGNIRRVAYRPFVASNCYADYTFIQMKYLVDRIFPDRCSENRVICVSGRGSTKPFSVLVTDTTPDLELISKGQCFPRYRYPKPADTLDRSQTFEDIDDVSGRIDNMSDTAVGVFREHYHNEEITKDAIFDYVYGILHAQSYREAFANNLSKELARIPFAPDFYAFTEAGKTLGELHLGYERCERYPLEVVFPHEGEPQARHFRLTEKAMRFADDGKTTLTINEHVRLAGIPAEAHRYVVNGRTPLEWYIDRYRIKRDKESGIVNDPNGWFEDPRDLVAAIERIVHVSVESTRIIEGLPREVTDGATE